MEAQRAHLTGSMRVYSKVAEHNAETLSSEDYSNIFPSQSGHSPGKVLRKRNRSLIYSETDTDTSSDYDSDYVEKRVSNTNVFHYEEIIIDILFYNHD